MARNNEIIAILCGGVSFRRMLFPFMFSATVIAGLSIYLNHFILPEANKVRLDFENKYFHNSPLTLSNVHREISPGVVVYFNNNAYGYLEQFSMDRWENHKLSSTLFAQRATCDSLSDKWTLQFYTIRYLGDGKDSILRGESLDTTLGFRIQDLGYRTEFPSSMTSAELSNFIEKERQVGSDNLAMLEIELHQRTAYPVAAYILTLIGICVAGRKSRGGLGVHFTIGLALAVLYIFSQKITTVAAMNVGLNASLAVWIPNLIFLIITVPLYRFAQK